MRPALCDILAVEVSEDGIVCSQVLISIAEDSAEQSRTVLIDASYDGDEAVTNNFSLLSAHSCSLSSKSDEGTSSMAAFISHVTLDHLAVLNQPSDTDLSGRTPALKASLEAKSAGYDAICLPLTNDKWKARWRDMCLIPAGGTLDRVSLEHQAEDWRSTPGFMRDEVTITHLGASAV